MVEQWFWCLDHRAVEGPGGCRAADRLGPYPTREEAARALDTVARRNASWEAEDDRG